MSESNYKKIFSGNIFMTQQIIEALKEIDITAVVKDDSESGRLAGFGTPLPAAKDIFVHENEYDKAVILVKKIAE